MKKILIVETNIERYNNSNTKTGLWLSELTRFYEVVLNAGYEVDFMSPNGGRVSLDPNSMKILNKVDKKWYEDEAFIKKALVNTKSPDEINADDYIAIYYTGGHGVLWDFPDNEKIQEIASKIYENGGYVTAVCHGVVGLLNIKVNGKNLIDGKRLTGFTNTEEVLSGKKNKVPFSTEDALKSKNAIYSKKRFFKSYAIKDERLITGQNPWSPDAVAKLLVESLKEDK